MDSRLKLEKLLKERGHSITRPRLAVFEILQKTTRPLSVAELARKLDKIDRASVYRTVELFEAAGIMHRVWTGFKSRIELSEEFSDHHHHFTCISCRRIISFESQEIEDYLEELEAANEFKLTHHSVELSGYCKNCKPMK
jgi:Fe2+ or Zn2+ uptake regulation protein